MTSKPALGVLDHRLRERELRRAETNRKERVERIGRSAKTARWSRY